MGPAEVVARLAAATHAALAVGGVGAGEGTVATTRAAGTLVLRAEGTWAPGGRPVRWRSESRWTSDGDALRVAWVRPGDWARAVLDEGADGVWTGRAPHACGADRYACTLRLDIHDLDIVRGIEVAWTIRGPAKAARVVTRFA